MGVTSPSLAQPAVPDVKIGDIVVLEHKVTPRDGEFRFSTSPALRGISCTRQTFPGAPNSGFYGYNYCRKLGQIRLGIEFAELQNLFMENNRPEPWEVRPVLMPLDESRISDQWRLQSYLIAVVGRAGKVNVLQLTGQPGKQAGRFAFSGISLGASRKSFPFSVELVDGTVYSIRIALPDAASLSRAFRPLATVDP
jgi:hypothetical protein